MMFEERPEGNRSLVDDNQLYLGAKYQAKAKPRANEKAKLSARQKANEKCDLPRKSLNRYTWQEIQRHSQETDQWLVINHKVYDVTGWADRHPGGRKVLNHYTVEDTTDVFRAMHPDTDVVRFYLKPLLIGELAPEEPNQERNKNSQLVEDFQELRRTLETMNMFSANLWFFFLHLAQILILEALAWVIVWYFGSDWLVTIFIPCLLTVAQGLSTKWWNNRHFQHHVKTNIDTKDPDIDVGPVFIVGDLTPVEEWRFVSLEFMTPDPLQNMARTKSNTSTKKQHLYFCMVAAPLFLPVYLNLESILEMYHRRYWEDIAWVSSFYIHYFITFGPFYGIFGTMVLINLIKLFESLWFGYVSQMSHIPMKISREENQDWLSTQVLATCNVEQSFFNDWFTGHLNFQIVHQALKKYGALWKEAYCTHPEI